jgi:hypothetical protein
MIARMVHLNCVPRTTVLVVQMKTFVPAMVRSSVGKPNFAIAALIGWPAS